MDKNEKIKQEINRNISIEIIGILQREGRVTKEKIVEIVKENDKDNKVLPYDKILEFAKKIEASINSDSKNLIRTSEKQLLVIVRSLVGAISEDLK